MAAQKEDRRIRRTKRLLRHALAELMNEKEFKDITVKEITDRADLNRGTFYFHYTDTYDLREKIEQELVHDFAQVIASYSPTPEDYSARDMLEQAAGYIRENHFLIRTLFQSGGLQDKFMQVIEQTIEKIQKELHDDVDEEQRRYRCRYCSCGIIGCMNMWLQEDGVSAEALIDNLNEMIACVIAR